MSDEPQWDEIGRPFEQLRVCPRCGETDEVGSYYGEAWCHLCGWRGALSQLEGRAP